MTSPTESTDSTDSTDPPPQGAGVRGPSRFQQGPIATALQLGPLASLAGTWKSFGPGFNAIWRPDNNQPPANSAVKRFLELNLTDEQIDFRVIPGVVPNRGFGVQPDLNLYGLHYLQRVSDADPAPPPLDPGGYSQTAGEALHIEPGLFMNVPASQADNQDTIVRMASIPHGVTVLMQGKNPGTTPVPGKPVIPPLVPFDGFPGLQAFTTTEGLGIQPISIAAPPPANVYGSEHVVPENQNVLADTLFPGSQSSGPFPADFQNFVNDPNSVLRNTIAGQDILGTITISLSADGVGNGIENIPFLGIANLAYDAATAAANPATDTPTTPNPSNLANLIPNAFVYSARATFWIEWVRVPLPRPPVFALGSHGPDPALAAIEPFWPEATVLQLQYSQLVVLLFNDILWPHVTVATLRLSAG